MSAATVVSLVIGGWGAVLATVMRVREMRHDRRSLKVTCIVAYRFPKDDKGEAKLQMAISVTAINEGRRPIEVTQVVFRRADGTPGFHSMPIPGDPPFARLLGDGQASRVYFDKAKLEEWQAMDDSPVRWAVVSDVSGNEYVGELHPAALQPDRPRDDGQAS
jgi:hypothetical protein